MENAPRIFESRGCLQGSEQSANSLVTAVSPAENQKSTIVGIRVQQFASSSCFRDCSCQCHARQKWRSFQLLDQFLGALFVGYSHAPKVTLRCDITSCRRHQRSLTTLVYVFPHWFLWQIWSVTLLYARRDGLEANLRVYRVRPASDAVFLYATTGQTMKLKTLFDKGDASPFDIEAESNGILLQVVYHLAITAVETDTITECRSQDAA